jgi:drug/metabolite transporter (DMT)-like permease
VGIALGLTAAVCWGCADVVAATTSRRVGPLQVALGLHVLSLIALAIATAVAGGLNQISGTEWPIFVGLGVLGALSYLMFYRALQIGPISIVSPIVSAYAAPLVVLAVLILDESLAAGEIVAIVVVISGALLASADLRAIRATERIAALGLLLALLTTLSLSGFTFGVSYYTQEYGLIAPFFVARAFTFVFLLAAAAADSSWKLTDLGPRLVALMALLAALDMAGYFAFNVGVRHADTSIVGTATAPYAVIPILVGVLAFRERPGPTQWLGIGLVIGGLVLLGLAS